MTEKGKTTQICRGDISPAGDGLFVDWQMLCMKINSGPAHETHGITKPKTLCRQLHTNDT